MREPFFLLFVCAFLCCVLNGARPSIARADSPHDGVEKLASAALDVHDIEARMEMKHGRKVRELDRPPPPTECGCATLDKCKCNVSSPVASDPSSARCTGSFAKVKGKVACDSGAGRTCGETQLLESYLQPDGCPSVGRPDLASGPRSVAVVDAVVEVDRLSVNVRWAAPPLVKGVAVTGYLVEVLNQKRPSSRLPPETCGCTIVPPCQKQLVITRFYSYKNSLPGFIDTCLPLPGIKARRTTFRVTALPLSLNDTYDRLGEDLALPPRLSSTEGVFRVEACASYDWRKLPDICKLLLSNRPPHFNATHVKHSLANHSLHMSWTKPLSNLTIMEYKVYVSIGLDDVKFSTTLPPKTLSLVVPDLNASTTYKVSLQAVGNLNLSTMPELPDVLADLNGYERGSNVDVPIEEFKASLNQGVGVFIFSISFGKDGHWSKWELPADSPVCDCNYHGTQTWQRTCVEPLPRSGGVSCSGTDREVRMCPTSSCVADSSNDEKTNWYRQPVFYVTTSTALLVLLLTTLVVIRVASRRLKRTRSGYQQAGHDSSSIDAHAPLSSLSVTINSPTTIHLETDFTPPDIYLVLSYNANINWNSHGDTLTNIPAFIEEVDPPLHNAVKVTTVYISYSRFSDIHDSNVLAFSAWLTHFGFNVILDKWDTIGVGANIASWTERNLVAADKVVVVLSSEYYFDWYSMENRPEEEERSSDRQACLEAKLIQTLMMEGRCGNRVCVPVFLGPAYQRACLPTMLESSVWFRLLEDDFASARSFVHYLCGVEEHQRPDFTDLKALDPPESPTDIL